MDYCWLLCLSILCFFLPVTGAQYSAAMHPALAPQLCSPHRSEDGMGRGYEGMACPQGVGKARAGEV